MISLLLLRSVVRIPRDTLRSVSAFILARGPSFHSTRLIFNDSSYIALHLFIFALFCITSHHVIVSHCIFPVVSLAA
jgi:hypothetical protein